jgi:hypothetical protein
VKRSCSKIKENTLQLLFKYTPYFPSLPFPNLLQTACATIFKPIAQTPIRKEYWKMKETIINKVKHLIGVA